MHAGGQGSLEGVLEFREVWQRSGGEKASLAVWPGEWAVVMVEVMEQFLESSEEQVAASFVG